MKMANKRAVSLMAAAAFAGYGVIASAQPAGQKAPAAGAPAAAAPGAAPAAPAAPTPPPANINDAVGDWSVGIFGLPGVPQVGEIHIEKVGDAAKGKIKTTLGEKDADSVKVVGPNVVMSFFIEAMGQSVDAEVSIKPAGETFTGSMLVGGGMIEATLKGAKVGSAAEKALKEEVAAKVLEIVGVPELPIADAKAYMGEWVVSGDSPMGPMTIDLSFKDVDGKVSSELMLPPPLGAQTINRLKIAEGGAMTMAYSIQFMGQDMDMSVELERQGALITGLIDVGGGMAQIPLEGFRKGRGLAKGTVGGKTVTIEYGKPSTSGPGYASMDKMLKEGFVWRLGKDDITSLTSNAEIKVGDKTLPAGSYGLFAKRTGDSWTLLFSSQNSGNGMTRKPENDLASTPMTKVAGETGPEELTITTTAKEGNKLEIKIAWGKEVSTGTIEVVVPPPPPAPAGAGAGAAKPAAPSAPAGAAKPAAPVGGAAAPAAPGAPAKK